jgi:hypothetical protein
MPSRTATPVTAGGREVFRLAPPVVLWWVWLVFVILNVADYAVQGLPSARFGAVISAILLAGTGLVYTLALRPRVVADEAGVTVVNPFRVHHVPWRLIQAVDTGEWVRLHYMPADETSGETPPGETVSSAAASTLSCWALYVSARAKRKMARGAPRPRRGWFGMPAARAESLLGEQGYGNPSSRLPDEARRLASLPVAQAMASRLDTRAARERARGAGSGGPLGAATASWSWLAIAVATVPVVALVIVAVLA